MITVVESNTRGSKETSFSSSGAPFTLAINICTFLYAGLLIHRSRISNVNQLIDTTPTPNWILLLSIVTIFTIQAAPKCKRNKTLKKLPPNFKCAS